MFGKFLFQSQENLFF